MDKFKHVLITTQYDKATTIKARDTILRKAYHDMEEYITYQGAMPHILEGKDITVNNYLRLFDHLSKHIAYGRLPDYMLSTLHYLRKNNGRSN